MTLTLGQVQAQLYALQITQRAASTAHAEVYLAAAQSMVGSAVTQVKFDTVESNPGNAWSPTAWNFTPPLVGRYLVTAAVGLASVLGSNNYITVYYNAAEARRGSQVDSNEFTLTVAAIVRATDVMKTIDVRYYNGGTSTNTGTGAANVYAQFSYLGPL